ncbi:MAG: CapA family protein, partial [Roseburia sp.]|nr:CapA family protein [Roseburia sp.]
RLVSEELLAEMQNADICMVNNEFQFSNRGTPMEDKKFTFQTDPKNVQILLDMGVDIVSLANNHSIDFGTEALEDTFATLDGAGILYAGAGDTKERAEQLQIIEVNGQKIGFLAATRVIPVSKWNIEYGQPGLFATYDDSRLVECIKAAKEVCDFLTVYVHWGIEREAYPQEYQTNIAKNCFAAGADLIIGAHPHVLQGIEFIDGKPVFYSLGNYVFAQTIAKTALIKVEIQPNGDASYKFIPAFAESGKTQLCEEEKAAELIDYMNEISMNAYIDEAGNVCEKP